MMLSKNEIHIIPAIIISIIILLTTYYINRILQRMTNNLAKAHNLERQLVEAIEIFTRFFVYSIGITLCLENLHVQLSALFGTLGVVAIGIGLALQDTLASITSGVFILYYKPFFIGDYINFTSNDMRRTIEGKIIDINLRITTLEFENSKILVPNSVLYHCVVVVQKNS